MGMDNIFPKSRTAHGPALNHKQDVLEVTENQPELVLRLPNPCLYGCFLWHPTDFSSAKTKKIQSTQLIFSSAKTIFFCAPK